MWCFGVKESEYDVQMTIILLIEGYSWDMEVKSTKEFNFQSYFLLSSHISATSFIWMHISRSTTYYLLPWPPHWICMMANHGMCDEKCHLSWLYLLQFFLQNIPHLNYQQNITECFETIINIRGGHAPGHHDLHIRFSNWPLVMAHPSNWILL